MASSPCSACGCSYRGAIPSTTPTILARLGMDAEGFINAADHFFKDFASAVGTPTSAGRCAAWQLRAS